MSGRYMVFDVESIGLHGEGWSVGWVVVDEDGNELSCGQASCSPDFACGKVDDRRWVRENCPMPTFTHDDPEGVRQAFWQAWLEEQRRGAMLVADCAWPVEARFLIACVEWDTNVRNWRGPYPLHEVATARMMAGLDPLGTETRLPRELPKHDALSDARQSARLWIEALRVTA